MLEIDLFYRWTPDTTDEAVFDAHYQVAIPAGMTTLLGGSGEGKSTLLHLLGGFINGQGSIKFLSKEISHLTADKRPITTLFQNDNLFPQLSVWQNIAIGLSTRMSLNGGQRQAVEWALDRTKLTQYKDKKPDQLSGGQVQRVAIARAIARAVISNEEERRPILLLDEPFSALDPSLRMEMMLLVANLTAQLKLTTLLVSHLPDEIKKIAGQLVLIEKGKVVLQADSSVLNQTPLPDELKVYLT